jgi:hypothetical protein
MTGYAIKYSRQGNQNEERLSHTAAPRPQQHTSGASLLAVLVGNQNRGQRLIPSLSSR